MGERRRAKRIKVAALPWLIGERDVAKGSVHDLSAFGAKVSSDTALQTGDAVKIKVELPEGRGSFLTLARVIWSTTANNHRYPCLIGIEFIKIGKDESAKLEAFVTEYGEIPVRIPIRGGGSTSNIGGDIAGGTTATILAYGTIVFAPLGPDYVGLGVVAGLIALCFSNLGAAASGGVRVMNNGPYSLSSLMLASSITIIARNVSNANVTTVIGLLLFIVFLCGLFQIVFGLLKFGELVKYIPYPVTSGLLNGTAILIFLGQIRPMLGLSGKNSLLDFGSIQPFTFLVGLVTVLAVQCGSKLTRKIPAPFLGIGR